MRAEADEKFRVTYGRAPELVARAPGRIEFIGNHTDYNGGTVLGAAIDRSLWVALARRTDGQWNFSSAQRPGLVRVAAGDFTRRAGADAWANYPLGVLQAFGVLGLRIPAGFDFLAVSDLPPGAGLSSSAAIELASALVFARAAGEDPPRETLVRAARHAENHNVGEPFGILDKGVSGFGRRDHLVRIDCRGPSYDRVPLPPGVHFWIFNPPAAHALVDGRYAERHRECMAAAQALGVACLADATPAALDALQGRVTDAVARRARHVVEEIARVDACVAALAAGNLAEVGRLLSASHRSSQVLFENSTPELDFLVATLIATPHVYGARLTGGGFGGAVMAMTTAGFDARAADQVAAAAAARFGARPQVLHLETAAGAELL
ncbi:MAG: galactokinase [Opitutaceae bacterium]|nr:galactokinase [Opitutaceae bacterium]